MPDQTCFAAAVASSKWGWLPFVFVGATGRPEIDTRSLFTSLLQAAIVAGVVLYANTQVLDQRISDNEERYAQRIEQLARQVEALQSEIRAMRADLYRPVVNR